MTSPALYTQTKCNINGKEQPGKVIAVATYFDHRKVCFLTEGQAIGEWVSESALIPNLSPSEQVTKDIKPYIPANKVATFEVKQDIPSEYKKLPNTFPNSIRIPSFSSAERVKTEANEYTNVEEEAKTEAEQDIHALVKFVTDTQKAIENKTAQDIQTVFNLFAEAKSAIEQKIQAAAKSLQDADKQAREWLNQATKGIGQQVVSPLIKTLTDYGKIWRDRLVETINSVDLKKAKEAVNKLKETYPKEKPWQIANRLIQEKAIFATITGLAGVVPGASIVVDWFGTNVLLVEIIYQIAVCYGFDKLDSEQKGEILAIYLIASSSDTLITKLGLEFLKHHTPVSGAVISAATNVILFHAVGYAACEFYEAKSKKESFTELGKKVEAYLEQAISEKAAVEKAVDKAVSMKGQLVLS